MCSMVRWKIYLPFLVCFLLGLGSVLAVGKYLGNLQTQSTSPLQAISPIFKPQQEVIGFLPYWLIDKADKNYDQYLTTLTYFGLTAGPDGAIVKLSQPGQEEPGWYALESGKLDTAFSNYKKDNIKLSLAVFSGDQSAIDDLISDPASHAATMMGQVTPIMHQYGFTDLNLDVESVIAASDSARQNFTTFVRMVKNSLDQQHLGTLTVDVSPTDLIEKRLINPTDVAAVADRIVLMTYDYHFAGSAVTGPVAPIGGAGIDAEYDTETAVQQALKVISPEKIVLGVPLYGYEWETVGTSPRSAVIATTGQTASNRRMEDFLATCATCSANIDTEAVEPYIIYHDQGTGTFHQIFYPNSTATVAKIGLANKYQIGGLALWALGYDGTTILNPLAQYKQSIQP